MIPEVSGDSGISSENMIDLSVASVDFFPGYKKLNYGILY
jgi:hypothetical protein